LGASVYWIRSDTDIVPCENITPINLINPLCVILFFYFLFCLIGVVFSNCTMLSVR